MDDNIGLDFQELPVFKVLSTMLQYSERQCYNSLVERQDKDVVDQHCHALLQDLAGVLLKHATGDVICDWSYPCIVLSYMLSQMYDLPAVEAKTGMVQ